MRSAYGMTFKTPHNGELESDMETAANQRVCPDSRSQMPIRQLENGSWRPLKACRAIPMSIKWATSSPSVLDSTTPSLQLSLVRISTRNPRAAVLKASSVFVLELRCCALEENRIETEGPVGVVHWTNKEGARFPVSMMGSGVWCGRIPLDKEHN